MTPQEIEALKRDVLEAQGLSLTDVLSTGDTLKKYAVLEAIDHLIAQGWGPQNDMLREAADLMTVAIGDILALAHLKNCVATYKDTTDKLGDFINRVEAAPTPEAE